MTELVRALVDTGTTGTGLRVTCHVTIDRLGQPVTIRVPSADELVELRG